MSQKSLTLNISGMHCTSCVTKIEKKVSTIEGVQSISLSFVAQELRLRFDPSSFNKDEVLEAIKSLGYTASEKIQGVKEKSHKIEYLVLVLCAIGALVLFGNMVIDLFGGTGLSYGWQFLIALLVQCIGGGRFYIETYKALKQKSATMDTLVALGTTIALLFSFMVWVLGLKEHAYFETSVLIIAFVLTGRMIEMRSLSKARSGMQALVKMQAKDALVVRKNREVRVALQDVNIGDVVLVKPGESIPIDGKIIEGESYINESMITGESAPIRKEIGCDVTGGTVNKDGRLLVRCMNTGVESLLGKMISLVEAAQSSKPKIQKLVDRVSGIFVPIILIIALLTFLLWVILAHNGDLGLRSAVAVLIIACPCSLGLATPIVIMISANRAAKKGILLKDFASLDQASRIKHLVLDKTGTVTQGKMELISLPDDKEALRLSGILSRFSSHPLAQSIESRDGEAKSVLERPGLGIEGVVEGKQVYMGSMEHLQQNGVEIGEETWEKTSVFIAIDGEYKGAYYFEDVILPDAKETIELLRQMKIESHLVSGDRSEVVERVAKEVGIEKYLARARPEDKCSYIDALSGKVGMVGDGVNDAPALAKADVGIAMSSGTDIAMETASVALLNQRCHGLVDLIHISRITRKRIIQNLFLGFGYNILAVPLAAFGLLNPIIAAIAMSLSSVTVVGNSLRKY